ncbi:MAG TPA: DUF6580 family putative transport protein [Acidobacteriaceae bacterium]
MMAAYLLMVLAVLSRVVPFPGMNFTAVGAGLLYFGARRPLKEMALPVLTLMATDFYLTLFVYHYAWHTGAYLATWAWYAGVILLGRALLRKQITVTRVVAGPVVAATSFFAVSNFAVWAGGTMYPMTMGGLTACYAAALPFYRNDLLATTAIAAVAFGATAVVERMARQEAKLAA